MRYNLIHKTNQEKAKEYLQHLINKKVNIELKEVRKIGTLKQNNYAHLLFSKFGLFFGYKLQEVKQDIFKRIVNKDIFLIEKNGLVVCRSSSDLDTKEYTIAIERFRNYSNENGCYLPSPDEKEFLQSIKNEIYKYENQIYL